MVQPIIVGVGGSARSQAAAVRAAGEATLRGLPLHLVHASPVPEEDLPARWPYCPEPTPDALVKPLQDAHTELQVEGIGRTGAVVATLLALGTPAGPFVLGLRGAGGFAGLAVGSMAHGVAELAGRPVVLMPNGSARTAAGGEPTGSRSAWMPVTPRVPLRTSRSGPQGSTARGPRAATTLPHRAVDAVRAARGGPGRLGGPGLPSALGLPAPVAGEVSTRTRVREGVLLKTPAGRPGPGVVLRRPLVVGRSSTALGPTLHAVLAHSAYPVAMAPSRHHRETARCRCRKARDPALTGLAGQGCRTPQGPRRRCGPRGRCRSGPGRMQAR